MNGKTINLIRADNGLYKRNSVPQYLLIILYFLYGLFYLYKGNFSLDNSDTIFGTFAIVFVIAAFIYTKKMIGVSNTFQLVFNDHYIKYRYSLKNKGEIKLEELDHIELKILKIIFLLKNGEKKEFHLENLSYKTVLQVKEEIKNFADNKNIQLK